MAEGLPRRNNSSVQDYCPLSSGLVAVSSQPMRDRMQRGVHRLMFGERDEPYTVLNRLSERLEVVVAFEQVRPAIVATAAQALKPPYARNHPERGR